MATLVLTVVGTAVGGPVGGAIGAFIGQQIDQRVFAPKARRGPRLGELAVQTSNYGSDIPKLFGRMRVAGTVIWSTDLQERRAASGGGKGAPKTLNYSYSASFAVALSGRPVQGVGRIWADGKLLRGEAGDFKSATGFRFYSGGEEQEIDPLIAAAEGADGAPAYRGTAYAVFEDFELADYGNRIPSLTFEVAADGADVAIGVIGAELSDGEIGAGETPALNGYAAGGETLRAALEDLADLAGLRLFDREEGLVLAAGGAEPPLVIALDAVCVADGGVGPALETSRRSGASLPAEVSLTYYDPARDYQTGLQRAVRARPALAAERRALPAALDAEAAKGFAEARLRTLWAGREAAKVRLPWRESAMRPGALVRLEGREGLWRAHAVTLERKGLELELVRIPGVAAAEASPASPGRPIGHPDVPHGQTRLRLLDSPLTSDALPTRPQLFVAAAGAEEGWRRAELTVSFDGGASWQPAGGTAPAAVLGTALGALEAAGSALIDERGAVEVILLNDSLWLESRSVAALSAGANLAMLGDELIQFATAQPLGDRRFRLSRLLRGRRGTEWAAAAHSAGETFALIEAATLATIEAPVSALGAEARVLARGLGDTVTGAEAVRTVTGEGLRPPSPVHLAGERQPDGGVAIRWVRRSRNGWTWLDGGDAPLGEEREAYRLTLTTDSSRRVVELGEPAFLYSAAAQLSDGAAGSVSAEVVQLGTTAPSRPASILID